MQLLLEYITSILTEDATAPSCRYEALVIKSLKSAGIAGHLRRAACSNSLRPDADVRINGELHYVEVKSNSRAQMGGGSVGYSLVDKEFFPAGINRELSETLAGFLNDINDSSLHKGIKNLLTFLSRQSTKDFDRIPMSGFDATTWKQAVDNGLLLTINRTLEGSIHTIAAHYAKKNTFYVQIGGSGFFRLSEENPANLPVPILNGKVSIELRVAKSGDQGESSKAGLRAQARLVAKNSSPYSLDDPDSIKKMLKASV